MSITKKMHLFARNNFLRIEVPNSKSNIEPVKEDSLIMPNENEGISTNQNEGVVTNQNDDDVNDLMFDMNIWMRVGKFILNRDDEVINKKLN